MLTVLVIDARLGRLIIRHSRLEMTKEHAGMPTEVPTKTCDTDVRYVMSWMQKPKDAVSIKLTNITPDRRSNNITTSRPDDSVYGCEETHDRNIDGKHAYPCVPPPHRFIREWNDD